MMILPLKRMRGSGTRKKRRVSYDKFCGYATSEKGTICAVNTLNCDCRGGVLTTGIGIKPYLSNDGKKIDLLPAMPLQIGVIKQWDGSTATYKEILCFLDGRRSVFCVYPGTGSTVNSITAMSNLTKMFAMVDKDRRWRLVMVGHSGLSFFDSSNTYEKVRTDTMVESACVAKHRLFAGIKPDVLLYSSPDDERKMANSLDESGEIYFTWDVGCMVALKEFNDKVYVFFERGIAELECAGLGRDFKVRRIPYEGGNICGGTVGRCGRYIYFASIDGLWQFDGKKAVPVLRELEVKPSRSVTGNQAAVFCEGRLLIQYYDTQNSLKELVVYEDGKSGYFSTFKAALTECGDKAFCYVDDCVQVACFDGDLPELYKYNFETGEMDFGVIGQKVLQKLRFKGLGSFDFEIRCIDEVVKQTLVFEDGVAEMNFSWRGERFAMKFFLHKGAKIEGLEVEFLE